MRHLTSVAAVKGDAVRCVTAQRFALLRSQLILFEPLQQNAALGGKLPFSRVANSGDPLMIRTCAACVGAFTLILSACERSSAVSPSSESIKTATAEPTPALPPTKSAVISARKKFRIELISFDASQQYGSDFPYYDKLRVRVTNASEITLRTLTLLTKRFDSSGKMIGSSRAPSISVPNLMPGKSAELDYYARGHLPNVSKITVEIEKVITAANETLIEEIQAAILDSALATRSAGKLLPPAANHAVSRVRTVSIGTIGDTVLAWRGKAISSTQAGTDDRGLLVEWRYPDVTYLMGRRLQAGIDAYRIIKITANQ